MFGKVTQWADNLQKKGVSIRVDDLCAGEQYELEIPEKMKKRDPEEEERMHEEELRRRLEAMDERDLQVVAQYIPCDILIDRLRSELAEKMEWKIKIDEMYKRFHNI